MEQITKELERTKRIGVREKDNEGRDILRNHPADKLILSGKEIIVYFENRRVLSIPLDKEYKTIQEAMINNGISIEF